MSCICNKFDGHHTLLTADGETMNFLMTIFSVFANESNKTVLAPND